MMYQYSTIPPVCKPRVFLSFTVYTLFTQKGIAHRAAVCYTVPLEWVERGHLPWSIFHTVSRRPSSSASRSPANCRAGPSSPTPASSGKTAFTRGLARGLGCRGRVTSPTFTIVNEYEGDIPLFHFDLYRLGSSDELFDIGWEDYLARGGVCAVEWSERAEDAFDGSTVRIDFRRGAQHDGWRVITITGVDGL